MPLREDILNPIPGDNPGGQDLRYAPVYDKIREARREDDALDQGVWRHERKVADWPLVIKLAQDAIATQSKDLQLAAWLSEALLRREGFGGLKQGLQLCHDLLSRYWDHLYPELEDGDAELRAAPLDWLGTRLEFPVKNSPLCLAGYDLYQYKDSRLVPSEDQAGKDKDKKTAREAALKAGKLAPELFDKSFAETEKKFYAQAEANLDGSLAALASLDELCAAQFGDVAPAFGKLRGALEDVRHTVHSLLQKKRETDPDPVEEAPAPLEAGGDVPLEAVVHVGGGTAAVMAPAASYLGESPAAFAAAAAPEPAGRREAIDQVIAAAAFLRKREPSSPAPYLMLRGLRFGELRAALESRQPAALEAPPTEVRRQIKMLAMAGRSKDLIEAAESVMALPCSRAWLDLQRLVVDACVALGPEYGGIAVAIRSELRALVRDFPQLPSLTLTDDTAAANPDTQAWLRALAEEPEAASPKPLPAQPLSLDGDPSQGWQQPFVDAFQLATEAVRRGQEQKAFEILNNEILRQRSGRGRFERRLQLVQLCMSTGKEALMQPILDDLIADIEAHKLDDWEDREKLASALVTILKASKKIQGDAKEKQKLFERICRLDPVQALQVG